MAGEVSAHHHFYWEWLAFETDGDIGIRRCENPIGHYVFCGEEIGGGDLIQYSALVRNCPRKNDIEGGDAICRDHRHEVAKVINIPDLTAVKTGLPRKIKVRFLDRVHVE